MKRTTAFVDGFNLYHAIVEQGKKSNHLKWLDLRKLCAIYAPSSLGFSLGEIYFFTAYAPWRRDSYLRHLVYVRALESVGVTPIVSKFKKKTKYCPLCKGRFAGYEEKETDVQMALRLFEDAILDQFDRALLVSGDSDLAPAVDAVLKNFPAKEIRIVTPVGRKHSVELSKKVGGYGRCASMKKVHLESALLPAFLKHPDGGTVRRPSAYAPPPPTQP